MVERSLHPRDALRLTLLKPEGIFLCRLNRAVVDGASIPFGII